MRQVFQRSRLGVPYDAMVERTHDRVLELLGAAQRGDEYAVLLAAERVADQAGALKELLDMKRKEEV